MKSSTAIILFTATLSSAAPLLPRALNFGTCSNPTIVFGPGFDGRNQDSFEPTNEADFNHGSALNIGVIASFICGQLQSACKAGADAVAACATAQKAAAGASGQAAADAFNAALGFGAGGKAATPPPAASPPAAANPPPAAECSAAPAAQPQKGNAGAGAAAASASGNFQKFTGALGGIAASPVVDSGVAGRPFKVVADGSTDVNLKAALQRSCDIQHNACANAANSGKLAGGTAQCDAQQKACVAA